MKYFSPEHRQNLSRSSKETYAQNSNVRSSSCADGTRIMAVEEEMVDILAVYSMAAMALPGTDYPDYRSCLPQAWLVA